MESVNKILVSSIMYYILKKKQKQMNKQKKCHCLPKPSTSINDNLRLGVHSTNCPHLYILCECPEHLLGNLEGLKEVLPPLNVDGVIVRVMPVEIRDALLETEEIVHSADDDVHCGRVASLSSKVVLEVSIVAFAEKLKESKQAFGEEVVRENLAKD